MTETATPANGSTAFDQDEWLRKVDKLANRKPAEQTVTIPDNDAEQAVAEAVATLRVTLRDVRDELAEQVDEDAGTAEEAGDDLAERVQRDPRVVEARQALEDRRREADDAAIPFVFRQLPPHAYGALVLRHQPTDEQEEQGHTWNPDTYPPALISACSVYPLSEEQADALLNGPVVETNDAGDPVERGPAPLNIGEANLLFRACLLVNEDERGATLGKGSRRIPS